jgi:hypothetical protein
VSQDSLEQPSPMEPVETTLTNSPWVSDYHATCRERIAALETALRQWLNVFDLEPDAPAGQLFTDSRALLSGPSQP